jgi:cell division protein FtsL
MATSPSRRRERSVGITAASLLLVLATTLVVATIALGSFVWLSAASVVAAAAGWITARTYQAQLLTSRREAGRERAVLATEYRDLLGQQAEEQSVFLSALTEQMVFRERELADLQGVVGLAERRAEIAEGQLQETREQLEGAQELLKKFQPAIPQQSAGPAPDDAIETVVDLLGWGRTTTAPYQELRRQA